MEHNTEAESCSSGLNNISKKKGIEVEQEGTESIEKKEDDSKQNDSKQDDSKQDDSKQDDSKQDENKDDDSKQDENKDDDTVIEVEIDKEEVNQLPANILFQFKTYCDCDDSLWSIDSSDYLTEGDLDVPLGSKVVEDDCKNDPKTLEIKKILTMPSEKLEDNFFDKENIEKFRTKEKSGIPDSSQDEDVHSSKISNIDDISPRPLGNEILLDMKGESSLIQETILNKIKNNHQVSNEKNVISNNSSELKNSNHLADISGQSCSKNETSLPIPSCSKSPNLSNSSDADLNDILTGDTKEETKFLMDFYRKCFLKDTIESMKESEDIEVQFLEECDYVKSVMRSTASENDNENVDPDEAKEFFDDVDVLNEDIIYNIDLYDHYLQMETLIQLISETPDDLAVLNKCLNFPPIPQVQHEPETFTEEDRLMFMNGISKWEYKINKDDWNKIMVRRATIFAAHAGFSVANEESLYVLADVAIDYIKKLAVIMKHNFDIQSNSSNSSSIDPVNISLQQIGIEGGVKAVIDHYQHDVIDRRDKLMKKCQHLQKIINQYIESKQPNTSNQYAVDNDFIGETSTSGIVIPDKGNVLLQGIETETVVVNDELQSILEEGQHENQSKTGENTTSIERQRTEPECIDNTDFEAKMDNDSRDVESITTEIKDRKLNNQTTVGTENMNIDLLKPIPTDENALRSVSECFVKVDKEKILKEWTPSCGPDSFAERKKKGQLLDLDAVKKILAHLYPSEDAEHDTVADKNAQEMIEIQKEFEEDFKLFDTLSDSEKASNDEGPSQTDQNVAQEDNSIPIQTVIVSDNSDEDEDNFADTNITVVNIPVIDNNLEDNDHDLVSNQPKSSSD